MKNKIMAKQFNKRRVAIRCARVTQLGIALAVWTALPAPAGAAITQQAYLKASNTQEGDRFGAAVAMSGDTLVIGADEEDSNARGVNGSQSNNDAQDAGAAYVFVRNGTTWTQEAYLKPSNTRAPAPGQSGSAFGAAVAISGDTLVVGAPNESSSATGVNGNQNDNNAWYSGAAYIFVRSGTNWT